MKKLVSLLLVCLMVLSISMLPAFATTETELFAGKEAALTDDTDLPSKPATAGGIGTTILDDSSDPIKQEVVVDTVGAKVKKDGDNIYFELAAYNTRADGYWSHKLFIDDYDSTGKGNNSTKIKKFSAFVSVPSVEQGTTNVFGKATWNTGDLTTGFNTRYVDGFGVQLRKGGAYYYDMQTAEYVNFVADGTMQADKYYRIEAISDFRGRTSTSAAGPNYMRAFVYDGTTLLGETGWVYPSNESYKYDLDGRTVGVEAYGYPEQSVVKIDEFKVYKLDSLPTYGVYNGITEQSDNYISTPSNQSYRNLGQVFQRNATGQQFITSAEGAYLAARVQVDVRFPVLADTDEFNLLDFYSSNAGNVGPSVYTSGSNPFTGTVNIAGTTLTVRSHDGSEYSTPVALTNGATSYTVAADTWYTLVWDIDYSQNYDAPSATLTVKNEAGDILVATSAPYTAEKMPINKWSQNTASILYCASKYKNKEINLDNTKLYVADTLANLDTDNRHVITEEDFEDYESGTKFDDITKNTYTDSNGAGAGHLVSAACSDAVVTYEIKSAYDFVDGMTLPATKATTLKLIYSNDVANANINYDNIKFFAGSTALTAGVDYILATANDGAAADTSKTFTIEMPKLSGNTNYTIRLMANLSDYNTSAVVGNAIMGVPADNGLYKDITFTTPDDVAAVTSIVPSLVDAEGAAVTALAKDAVIKGKVSILNADAGDLNGYVILAVYDGTELVTAKISDAFSIASGAENIAETETVTLAKDGLTAKVFVWNGLDLMQPLAAPAVVPVPAA